MNTSLRQVTGSNVQVERSPGYRRGELYQGRAPCGGYSDHCTVQHPPPAPFSAGAVETDLRVLHRFGSLDPLSPDGSQSWAAPCRHVASSGRECVLWRLLPQNTVGAQQATTAPTQRDGPAGSGGAGAAPGPARRNLPNLVDLEADLAERRAARRDGVPAPTTARGECGESSAPEAHVPSAGEGPCSAAARIPRHASSSGQGRTRRGAEGAHQHRSSSSATASVRLWLIAFSMSQLCRCGFVTSAAFLAYSAGSGCRGAAKGRAAAQRGPTAHAARRKQPGRPARPPAAERSLAPPRLSAACGERRRGAPAGGTLRTSRSRPWRSCTRRISCCSARGGTPRAPAAAAERVEEFKWAATFERGGRVARGRAPAAFRAMYL